MPDPERQVRFLYPPICFVASLLWGLHLDPNNSLEQIFPGATLTGSLDHILATAVTGSIILIASGLLIGASFIVLLTVLFARSGKPYEAYLTDAALSSVARRLNLSRDRVQGDTLYLSAMLDHDLIPDRLHKWVFRRWSMFYVYANSAFAILISLFVGPLAFGITLYSAWPLHAALAILPLAMNGCWAWQDTMGMLNFQAGIDRRPASKEPSVTNGEPE